MSGGSFTLFAGDRQWRGWGYHLSKVFQHYLHDSRAGIPALFGESK